MSVEKAVFGALPDGREVALYTLRARSGMTLVTTPYGCRIIRLLVPDRLGRLGDVILGHRTLEEYFGADYHGAFIGRYANRIGGAQFVLDGKTYSLPANDGANTLHGGPGGYHQVLWEASVQEEGDEPSITYTYESPDGEEGFPGSLKLQVTYTLKKDNTLSLEYTGTSDQATPFNPTNHAFFNLSGDHQKEVLSTWLQLNAEETTTVSDGLIPDGNIVSTLGGPLDFTAGKELGKDMFADDHLIQLCGGFDHNLCIKGEGFRQFGQVWDPDSCRAMEIWSDLPGVQLYTFNSVDEGILGKDGLPMKPHTAFCLETQFYPDSVHHENFPFQYLQPGQPFTTRTEYRFSVKK